MNKKSAGILYEHLMSFNARLAMNIFHPHMPGHVICELDNFLRMRYLGEIDNEARYVAIMPGGLLPSLVAKACPQLFDYPREWGEPDSSRLTVISEDHHFQLSREICLINPEYFIDIGLAGLKVALRNESMRSQARPILTNQGLAWKVSNAADHEDQINYQRRRFESLSFNPWSNIPNITNNLVDFLGGNCDKLALIHIRYKRNSLNAGTQTDPPVLGPSLAYLKDEGYTLVKVGTEPYPPEFSRYGVINYSESPLQNFGNDLILFKAAKFAMINASGVEHIPDLLGTPMVSYGRWQINVMPTSPNCVFVPSLLRNRETGRLLKFSEQILNYKNQPEPWEEGGGSQFPVKAFEERPPLPDEILAGVQEAIALGAFPIPRSQEQQQFFDLDKENYRFCLGRVSQKFLERFPEALTLGFLEKT